MAPSAPDEQPSYLRHLGGGRCVARKVTRGLMRLAVERGVDLRAKRGGLGTAGPEAAAASTTLAVLGRRHPRRASHSGDIAGVEVVRRDREGRA